MNKISTILPIIGLSIAMMGCDNSHISKKKNPNIQYCISGVVYYKVGYGMAPAFNRDSTVKTCGD